MNPEVIVVPYQIDDIIVNVIRDDIIFGGTKQRALFKYIQHYDQYNEFVYTGPSSGFAQVALTDTCLKLGKKITLFLVNPPNYEPYLSRWCEKRGANVKYFSDKIANIEEKAKEYVSKKSGAFLIPFGLDDDIFNDILLEQLEKAIPSNINPKRLWITVGSGTLLRTLAKIWPETEFLAIRVGKNLWEDQYEPEVWKRITIYTAPQKFFENVSNNLLPPYPSVPNYDAKVWQFVLQYGQDGDYIWNVASDNFIEKEGYYIKASDYSSAKDLIPLVRSGEIWFPFRKHFMTDPKILFERLKENHLQIKHPKEYDLRSYFPKFKSYLIYSKIKGKTVSYGLFRDQPTVVIGLQGENNNIDIITDYFIEDIRLETKRYDQEYSILEAWENDKDLEQILNTALKAGDIMPKSLRDAIYYTIQEAGTFQPSKARGLLEAVIGKDNLKGKKWLDISAGWGDRLIAAMSLDMEYIGYDPNIKLKKGHDEMIAMFGDVNKHKVIYQPFEQAEITGLYDVILTSPPFFDVEDYAHGQVGQSIVSYPNFTQWTVHFLFASLLKAWAHLNEGGYLILHLADARNQQDPNRSLNICEMTMIFIENYLPGASWEGLIGLSGESGHYRPTFVWSKISRYETPKRWVGKIGFNDRKLYNIPAEWISNNHYIPRTLYFTYPVIQKEVLVFYAEKLLPPNIVSGNNIDQFLNKVIEYFPAIEDGLIIDLFNNIEEIFKLTEILGLGNTIKWGIAMVKLALCDNINGKC